MADYTQLNRYMRYVTVFFQSTDNFSLAMHPRRVTILRALSVFSSHGLRARRVHPKQQCVKLQHYESNNLAIRGFDLSFGSDVTGSIAGRGVTADAQGWS